jgi:predicted P-loop ATPase
MIDLNDAPPQTIRHVQWRAIRETVRGRETEILDRLGIDWRATGSNNHIVCPYPAHDDHNPSWRWDAEAGKARCSCDSSASIFDVIMKIEGIDFPAAQLRAAELLGREDLTGGTAPAGLLLDEYAEAKHLPLDWLYSIGVTQKAAYGPARAPAVRTLYFREAGNFETASIRFRVNLNGDKKKRHFWRKGDKACLYGAHWASSLKEAGYAIIGEGESDTQTLWLHGFPALGLPGANTWNEERDAPLLEGVPVVYIVIEPDTGGTEVMKWLSRSAIRSRARLIKLPSETKDPSALYLARPNDFRAVFDAAMQAAQPLAAETISTNWHTALIRTENGVPLRILANAITAFREAPDWQGRLAYDAFHLRTVIRGKAPWPELPGDEWTAVDDIRAAEWLQHNHVIVGPEIAGQAVEAVARERRFHPVLEYLDRCKWDGKPRLDAWAITYLGAEDTAYVRAVSARWLMSAIARVAEPGCKADSALILEGPQGMLKSTALKTLANPWFTDELADFGTKDAALQLAGVWIVELAELDSISRGEVSRIKAFMSRTADRYRPPYAKRLIQQSRQCIYGGTVNHSEYLRDETGGRRFWPIVCVRIDIPGLIAARDQLWAEARSRYENHEQWWLDPPLEVEAKAEQEVRRIQDPWERPVAKALEKTEPKLTTIELLLSAVLNVETKFQDQRAANRVAACLHALGWSRRQLGRDVDVKILGDPEWEFGRENTLAVRSLKRGDRAYSPKNWPPQPQKA